MDKNMRMQDEDSAKAKTVEAGDKFLQELFRHHFGCEWSDHHSVLSVTSEGFNTSKPPDTVGELFVADVLKRFHNDGSFHEVNQ